jgi:hypothetical protein
LGGESKGKEPRRVHAYIHHQIAKRKVSNRHKKFEKKRFQKSSKRRNGKDTVKP